MARSEVKTRVVGLLGGTGAGKSTAAQWLKEHGATVIDADDVSRGLMRKGEPGYKAVVEEFGPQILSSDGEIDRRGLGKIVFSDPAELERLEGAVHPLMAEQIREEIAASQTSLTVLDCAVLLRPVFRPMADEIWVVEAPEAVRAQRIMKRDGLSSIEALDRISAQNTPQELRGAADRIISNSGTADELYTQLENALR